MTATLLRSSSAGHSKKGAFIQKSNHSDLLMSFVATSLFRRAQLLRVYTQTLKYTTSSLTKMTCRNWTHWTAERLVLSAGTQLMPLRSRRCFVEKDAIYMRRQHDNLRTEYKIASDQMYHYTIETRPNSPEKR